ncbi:uncharacterized protein LOC144927697 isoform X2 [Branchiostoma floridae x Branchiostoma belcheri]
MSQDGTWGDHLTLQALCSSLHIRVCIVSSSSGNLISVVPSGIASSAEVIHLGHISEEHYISLETEGQVDGIASNAEGGAVWDDAGYSYSRPEDVDSSPVFMPQISSTRNRFAILSSEEEEDNKPNQSAQRQRRRKLKRSQQCPSAASEVPDMINISDDSEEEETIPTTKRRRVKKLFTTTSEEEDNKPSNQSAQRQRRRKLKRSQQCPSAASEVSTGATSGFIYISDDNESQVQPKEEGDNDLDRMCQQSCHDDNKAIFHGRHTPVTNLEILDLLFSPKRITHSTKMQVTHISCNSSFLIDTSSNSDVQYKDAHVDAMGSWMYMCAKHKDYIVQGDRITLKRTSLSYRSDDRLKKAVVWAKNGSGEELPYVFVQYRYIGEPFQVTRKPHGNSKKSSTPYVRCNPSTLEMFIDQKKGNPIAGPSKICYAVTKAVGSSEGVSTQCKLPRGRQQVTDTLRKSSTGNNTQADDPVFRALLFMQEEGAKDNYHQGFVRTPQSSVHFLFNSRQINDIATFCTIDDNPAILGADITFKCGDFWLLGTTYKHLNLKLKGTDASPVMIGPMSLVQDKNKESYIQLFQKIVRTKPELQNTLKGYGTDGETNLIESLEETFLNAKGYRCTVHLWKNIKDKCHKLLIPNSIKTQIIDDLKNLCLTTPNFEEDFEMLERSWLRLANGLSTMSNLLKYIKRHIFPVLKDRVVVPGSQPYLYTQNACESFNAKLKRWESFQPKQIDAFIKDVKDMVLWQEENIVKAYLGTSAEWEVRNKTLQKAPEWLINKNIKDRSERKKQLLFMAYSPENNNNTEEGIEVGGEEIESIETEEEEWGIWEYALKITATGLSETNVKGIILKAKNLVDSGFIRDGFGGGKEKLVASETSKLPHCVVPMKGGDLNVAARDTDQVDFVPIALLLPVTVMTCQSM